MLTLYSLSELQESPHSRPLIELQFDPIHEDHRSTPEALMNLVEARLAAATEAIIFAITGEVEAGKRLGASQPGDHSLFGQWQSAHHSVGQAVEAYMQVVADCRSVLQSAAPDVRDSL